METCCDLLQFRICITSTLLILQAVDISSCGNFAVIGYSSGHVDMYNLQSGIYRGSYGEPSGETVKTFYNNIKYFVHMDWKHKVRNTIYSQLTISELF